MLTYKCDGFKPVQAADIKEAGVIFAERKARRVYGRKGYTRVLNCDRWTRDGSYAEFRAFIGVDRRPFVDRSTAETVGHDEFLSVYRI